MIKRYIVIAVNMGEFRNDSPQTLPTSMQRYFRIPCIICIRLMTLIFVNAALTSYRLKSQ